MEYLKTVPLNEKEALVNLYYRCIMATADSNDVEIVPDLQVNDGEAEEEHLDTQSGSDSDSDGDVVGDNLGLRRSKSRGRKAGEEDSETIELTILTMALCADVNQDQLTEMRSDVINALITGDQPLFTESTATQLAEIFFGQVFSAKAAQRLDGMIKFSKMERDGPQMKVVVAARRAADDASLTAECRDFFHTWGMVEESNVKMDSMWKGATKHFNMFRLYVQYERMIVDANDKTSKLRKMFRKKKLSTSVGRPWASVVRDFVTKRLGIDRTVLNNTIQEGKWLNDVCVPWGKGVLLLLPGNFTVL